MKWIGDSDMKESILLDTNYIYIFLKKTLIDELNQWLVFIFVENKCCKEKDDDRSTGRHIKRAGFLLQAKE